MPFWAILTPQSSTTNSETRAVLVTERRREPRPDKSAIVAVRGFAVDDSGRGSGNRLSLELVVRGTGVRDSLGLRL